MSRILSLFLVAALSAMHVVPARAQIAAETMRIFIGGRIAGVLCFRLRTNACY
jgi:hypothetical protein